MPITIPQSVYICNISWTFFPSQSMRPHDEPMRCEGRKLGSPVKAVCLAELLWAHSYSLSNYNISRSSTSHDARKELNEHRTLRKEAEVNCASFILNMRDSKSLNKGFTKDVRVYRQPEGHGNLCNQQREVSHTPLLPPTLNAHIGSRMQRHPRRLQTLRSMAGSPASLITPWKKVWLSIN